MQGVNVSGSLGHVFFYVKRFVESPKGSVADMVRWPITALDGKDLEGTGDGSHKGVGECLKVNTRFVKEQNFFHSKF